MTKRDAMAMALRVIGVWQIAAVLAMIPRYVVQIVFAAIRDPVSTDVRMSALAMGLGPPCLLVVAIVLLRWPDAIARRLVVDDGPFPVPAVAGNEARVLRLAFRIVGTAALALGARELLKWLAEMHPYSWRSVRDTGGWVPLALAILFGAYLLSGARHLLRFTLRKAEPDGEAQPG